MTLRVALGWQPSLEGGEVSELLNSRTYYLDHFCKFSLKQNFVTIILREEPSLGGNKIFVFVVGVRDH